MTKKYTKEELSLLAEIRLNRANKERSRAMPRRLYGDPANIVTFEGEAKMKRKAKHEP